MNNALTSFALGSWRAEKLNALQEYYGNLELFEQDKTNERHSKEENKIQEQQKVEGVSKTNPSKTKRARSNNKSKT